jgi:probable HAF family extracellular repeat protein
MKRANELTIWACILLVLAPLAVAQNQHAFVWSNSTGMTDVGTLGGNSSYALQINDSGEVAGWSYLADNVTTHAFTWTPSGGMVDIDASDGCCSQAQAINSLGEVAGDIALGAVQSPFFWSPSGGLVSLGYFTGDPRNYGLGINGHSQVTGQVYYGEIVQAFIWSPTSRLTPLGHLPGGLHSVGTAINNHASIVGTASLPGGSFTGFIWNHSLGMHDIGILSGGTYTAGEAINDSDQVAGWGFTNSSRTTMSAFYWAKPSGRHLLRTLGGDQTFAWGINQQGNIAGHSNLTGDTAVHATFWNSYTSVPTDLGTLPGGTNSYARGLNDVGQVVGYADVP